MKRMNLFILTINEFKPMKEFILRILYYPIVFSKMIILVKPEKNLLLTGRIIYE